VESHAKYTLVGAVVIALVSALVFAVVWITSSGEDSHAKFFTIYFREHDLSGTQVDSDVTMRGIKVGKVKMLNISNRDIQKVKVLIQVKGDTPIKIDTKAVIRRNLLTGLGGIDLIEGTEAAPALTDIPEDEEYSIIPEGKSSLEAIQKSLPEILQSTNQILERFAQILSPENKDALSKTLQNIEELTATLATRKGDLGRAVDAFTQATQELESGIRSFRQASQSLAIESKNISNDVGRVSGSVAGAADQFQNPREILFGRSRSTFGPGEGAGK